MEIIVKSPMVKKSWRVILLGEENEISTQDDDTIDLHKKFTEDLKTLNCSKNVYEG